MLMVSLLSVAVMVFPGVSETKVTWGGFDSTKRWVSSDT